MFNRCFSPIWPIIVLLLLGVHDSYSQIYPLKRQYCETGVSNLVSENIFDKSEKYFVITLEYNVSKRSDTFSAKDSNLYFGELYTGFWLHTPKTNNLSIQFKKLDSLFELKTISLPSSNSPSNSLVFTKDLQKQFIQKFYVFIKLNDSLYSKLSADSNGIIEIQPNQDFKIAGSNTWQKAEPSKKYFIQYRLPAELIRNIPFRIAFPDTNKYNT